MCGFQKKFKTWREWWDGDDENSILKQIQDMMWFAAIFEVLKQVHNVSLSNNGNKELPNWAFWNFIQFSHFEIQTNAIMRLLDKGKWDDVISLRRLIIDIKNNYKCLTRKNILESLDLPYDYEKGLAISDTNNANSDERTRCISAELMHKQVDCLVNITDESQRGPSDTIRKCVIDWIEKLLEVAELKDIEKFRHKFVAHAATNKSRNGKNLKDMEISLGKISQANEIICKIANFIAENILGDDQMSFLTSNITGIFENLDKPFVSQKDLNIVQDQFEDYQQQIKQWCNWEWSSEFMKSYP